MQLNLKRFVSLLTVTICAFLMARVAVAQQPAPLWYFQENPISRPV